MLSGEQRGFCRVLTGERKQGRCGWVVIESVVVPGWYFMVSVRMGAERRGRAVSGCLRKSECDVHKRRPTYALPLSPVHAVPVRAREPPRSQVRMHLPRRGQTLQVTRQEALQSDAARSRQSIVQDTGTHMISLAHAARILQARMGV